MPATLIARLADLAPRASVAIPTVDAATMECVDRLAIDAGLGLGQMLENAGRELAALARAALGGEARDQRVVVLAGSGNNAAGGMAAGRRLATWGAQVDVIFARPILRLRPAACAQLEGLMASGARLAVVEHDMTNAELHDRLAGADLILDALIGYRLHGPPEAPYAGLIAAAQHSPAPTISLDLPSGIDASTGDRPGVAVRADATLAVALPKRGIGRGIGRAHAGARYLADVGIPPALYAQLGMTVGPIFSRASVVRL